MAKAPTFVKQTVQTYHVYDEKALEAGGMHNYGASGVTIQKDKEGNGTVQMTASEARYYLGMGIVGTMPKSEWDNHFKIQEDAPQEPAAPAPSASFLGSVRAEPRSPIEENHDA